MHTLSLPRVFSLLFAFCVAATFFGQDLIARQAPIDRKMKTVDSVSINRVMKRAEVTNYENTELYTSWNTSKVHCYANATLPESYRIDLRGFAMPTPSRVVTSKFGYRPAFRRMHKGLDIKVYTGDTIVAAFDGKVRIVDYEAAGYGYYVVIRHKNGLETIYGHLSKQLVKSGDMVKAGEVIGLGGNTGRSYGSHLHFETRLLGVAINPALLFDFANQDVTGDYFVFHANEDYSSSSPRLVAKTDQGSEHTIGGAVAMQQSKHYKVSRGETLYSIAEKTGLTVATLCDLNGISASEKLKPGQILNLRH